uniref:Secreted protein n=1 Tax=Ixodes ricinus TaxID=34613 RepID=A0A6B0USG1_IXORI
MGRASKNLNSRSLSIALLYLCCHVRWPCDSNSPEQLDDPELRGRYMMQRNLCATHLQTFEAAPILDRYPGVRGHGGAALRRTKEALITPRDRQNILPSSSAFFLWCCTFVKFPRILKGKFHRFHAVLRMTTTA